MNSQTLIASIISLGIGIVGTHLYSQQGMAQMPGSHVMPDGTVMQNEPAQDIMSMDHMMQSMTANLLGKTGKDLEKAFIVDMIPHHQGAVDMAKILVADPTVSEKMKQFGNNIITAQEAEIRDMQEWVKGY